MRLIADEGERAGVHGALKPAFGEVSKGGSQRRNEQDDGSKVGEDAGGDQKDASDQDGEAIEKALGGHSHLLQITLNVVPGTHSFEFTEVCSGQGGGDDDPERWPEGNQGAQIE